jgi:hypothetical protein
MVAYFIGWLIEDVVPVEINIRSRVIDVILSWPSIMDFYPDSVSTLNTTGPR